MKRFIFSLLLLSVATLASAANTVTLNADLVSGNGSVSPTLTWSTSPVANSCTASGGWTGTKAASGTETIPAINVSKTFVLLCTWNTGSVVLTWTKPTQNTDGLPATDLSGYKIYRKVGSGAESLLQTLSNPNTLTFSDPSLTVGTYVYTLTAFNTANIESDHTNPSTKTITAVSDTQQIAVTVNPKPMPPGNVTIN